jgi:D-alanine-D-alanine ligase
MRIAVAYSSKLGLQKEYGKNVSEDLPDQEEEPPSLDFFAEGDSEETINAVMNALRSKGHDVCGVEADDKAPENLSRIRPDIVFNIAEGLFGDFRESYIPMVCERLKLPYSGSGPLTLAICLNKARTKEILSYYSIPNAKFATFHPGEKINPEAFTFPAIIKPIAEGSSKGIFDDSVVHNIETAKKRIAEKLKKYRQPVIIEEFLEGREFTVAVWGNGENVEVLPIVSINYDELPKDAHKIYSYEAKWVWDTPEKPLDIFQCPAKLTSKEKKAIDSLVKRTFAVLGVRDLCRVDVRFDSAGVPNILELNPLPGILPDPEDNSCFPKAARTAGYAYADMLDNVVKIASARCGLKKGMSRKS